MSPAQPDAAEMQLFFETLYPDVGDGWLVLSHPDPTRLTRQGTPALRSNWFDVAHAPWHRIAAAAARLARGSSVYFGVALQHPACIPTPWQRSKSATAYVVPGLWFDLDLAYGHHAASALPETDAEALGFLESFPARPSLIVHSGGGLYAYWLFRDPSVITSDAEREAIARLSRQFTATLVQAGTHHGWTLDALGDLARVLRPPGTVNHKYGTLVTLLDAGRERYRPRDFAAWVLDLPQPARRRPVTRRPALDRPALDILRVAARYGVELGQKSRDEVTGAHPVHGSSTGCNFSINADKGVWHCFRHSTGGGPLELIAVCEGAIACEAVGPGCLRAETFTRVAALANESFCAGIVLSGHTRDFVDPWLGPRSQWHGIPLDYEIVEGS